MNNSRKDTYELLSMSDSDSDTHQQIQELNFKSPRRKRLRKKLPSYRIKRYDDSSGQQCCHSYGKHFSLSFIIVILCCWLLILSWLVVIFNDELKRFDENSIQFASSNIPASLQKCHQETEKVQESQKDLYSNYVKLNSKLTNLSSEISVISQNLSAVQSKLNEYIDSLAVVPNNVKDIPEKVNMLFSWIKEVNDTVAQLQLSESNSKNFNSTSPKENSSDKVPTTHMFSIDTGHLNDSPNFISLVNKLTENITYINISLNSEIQLIKADHSRDHEILGNLSSFTYDNVSHKLNQFEDALSGITHKLSILSSSSNQTDAVNKTLSTTTDDTKSSKAVSPEKEQGKP